MFLFDKRFDPRKKYISYVDYTMLSPISSSSQKKIEQTKKGIIKDISSSGMFLETTVPDEDTLSQLITGKIKFHIEFPLPCLSEKKCSTFGELRWVKDSSNYIESHKIGCGIKFSNLSKADKEDLQAFVKTNE